MNLQIIERKSPILGTSKLACLREVATVNLAAGCAHGCVYCYTRGYSTFPGEGIVCLYQNLAERLKEELRRKRKLPKRVYFSPSSDLFQPFDELREAALEVLQILFNAGVEVAFLTKGVIPEPHFQLLERFSSLCFTQIGLITTDDRVRAIFEPDAASVAVRLAQIERLRTAGIPVTVRLDPILPEVTDSAETFDAICQATSRRGVQNLAASILFLRPGFASHLARHFSKCNVPTDLRPCLDALLARFRSARPLAIHAGASQTSALPLLDRLAIFARLTTSATRNSQTIHLCTCKNPDLPADFFDVQKLSGCKISGEKRGFWFE
ncbi:MAG: radical SAM protein [Planctomycetia bacterium]|nr:radical SAM protein [Planctomycetia bacterium]